MTVKIDYDNWSEESKRSLAYGRAFAYSGPTPGFYENAACRCIKCEQGFVFTAQEQKTAYEVRKEYIWKRRLRCDKCQSELERLQKKEQAFQAAWKEKSMLLQKDRQFLAEWLNVLESIPLYGKRENTSMIRMLKKALHWGG